MGKLKILIVEDDFLSRSLLAQMVSELGTIDIAVDGVEAVDAVKASYAGGVPYSLVFLDIMMPRKDGRTALREIRDHEASIGLSPADACKVVMTTALSDAKSVMGAFDAQCDAYVTKPFSRKAIDAEVGKLFPGSGERT